MGSRVLQVYDNAAAADRFGLVGARLDPAGAEVVAHYEATGEWRTPAQLQETNSDG